MRPMKDSASAGQKYQCTAGRPYSGNAGNIGSVFRKREVYIDMLIDIMNDNDLWLYEKARSPLNNISTRQKLTPQPPPATCIRHP